MATATSGREQAAATATALARRPDPAKVTQLLLPDVIPSTFKFSLTARRPTNVPTVAPAGTARAVAGSTVLDPYLAAFSWDDSSDSTAPSDDDSSATFNGTMTLDLPDPADPASIDVGRGYLVECNVTWGDRPFRLWEMECTHPDYSETDGTLEIPLTDEFAILRRGAEHWVFRQSKHHPRPYRTSTVIAAVCDHLGVKHRILYQGKAVVKNYRHTKNANEVIQHMIALETDRHLIYRMVDGTLEVLPFKPNPLLFVLAKQLESLEFTEASNSLVPYTAVVGKGRYGKNKKSPVHRTKHAVTDPALIKVYGYRPYVYDAGVVAGYSDLVAKSRTKLAQLIQVRRYADVTVPGLPFVRRGDLVELSKPQLGFTGSKATCTVESVTHTVGPGSYTSELQLMQKDVHKTYRDAQDAAARKKAAAKRKKK